MIFNIDSFDTTSTHQFNTNHQFFGKLQLLNNKSTLYSTSIKILY